jgi:F-type H+-transporting ATPase subunit epsilon
LFAEEQDMIIVPGAEGEMGVLHGHVPMVVVLNKGQVKAYLDGSIRTYDISGGFVHITKEGCNIIAD